MEKVLYKKLYNMRAVGADNLNTSVSLPPEVVRREAEKRGLKVDEFRKRFVAIAQYDDFDGILYTFEEKFNKGNEPEGEEQENHRGESADQES